MGVTELTEARPILCDEYLFSYYLTDLGPKLTNKVSVSK